MSRKCQFLVWVMVFVIILTGVAWAGCGASEPETATEPETTTEPKTTTGPKTTIGPLEPSQWPRGEGFAPRATATLSMLATIDDETIKTALQEAVEEGRITEKQAEDIQVWWAIRPEILSPDVFPIQMPTGNITRSR